MSEWPGILRLCVIHVPVKKQTKFYIDALIDAGLNPNDFPVVGIVMHMLPGYCKVQKSSV